MFGSILGDLAAGGYDAEWDCIPAASVGAPHRRDRVWVVAYSGGAGRQQVARGTYGDEDAHERRPAQDLHESASDGKGLRQRGVADAEGDRWSEGRTESAWQQGRPGAAECGVSLADAIGTRLAQRQGIADDAGPQQQAAERGGDGAGPAGWWESEPGLDRVAHGMAHRVDRLRTIGNGWVPQVAAVIAGRIATGQRSANREREKEQT